MNRIIQTGLAVAVLFGTALEIRFAGEVKDKISAIPCPCEKKRKIGDCNGKCSSHCSCLPKVEGHDGK